MTKEDRIAMLIALKIVGDSAIQKLDDMGFFTAPASTKYHGDYEGGLFDHSWEVASSLIELTDRLGLRWKNKRSPAIIGMFHDLCKCDQYKREDLVFALSENKTNVPVWKHNDKLLLKGHGEKSVMLLSQFMSLTEEEILCIRYHMGAYETDEWNEYDRAIRECHNVLWTHTADMIASKITGV